MGGFAFYDKDKPTAKKSRTAEESPAGKETPFETATDPRGTVDVPKYETLIYIMTYFPDIITNTPEEVILDRAKSSSLAKFILVVQVAKFCINCLSRLVQHLPLTLIEVSTAAHAFCTLLTYIVWFSKPMNVAVPTILRGEEAEEVYALLKCSPEEYDEALAMYNEALAMTMAEKGKKTGDSEGTQPSAKIALAVKAMRTTTQQPPPEPRFRTTDDSMMVPENFSKKSLLVAAICPILFGPIHFLAWYDTFPTPTERLLWYVSSGVVTCSGLVGVCLLFFVMMLRSLSGSKRGRDDLANVITVVVIPAIHLLPSGFLIVESFLQLTRLDPPSYQVASWAKYWPRIS